jgi:hypothetical protein
MVGFEVFQETEARHKIILTVEFHLYEIIKEIKPISNLEKRVGVT